MRRQNFLTVLTQTAGEPRTVAGHNEPCSRGRLNEIDAGRFRCRRVGRCDGRPESELTGPAFWVATQILATGGGLLAVSLALAVFAARRIAAPIGSLRRLAVATDRGSLPELMPTGLREMDEIADAFRGSDDLRRQSQNAWELLRGGIETMPEGFAVFDNDDRLVVCNESYRALFPYGPSLVVPGVRYEDLLRAGLSNGHYIGTEGREEKWIMERLNEHRTPGSTIEQ